MSEQPTARTARIAGVLYLLMGVTAPFSLIYVPRALIVRGDAAATAHNVLASETLLRLGIVGELFSATMSIFAMLALYRLLSGVNKSLATLMVILGSLVSVPISFLNVVSEMAALTLLRDAHVFAAFNQSQLDALAFLLLRMHGQGVTVVAIFWGLWLFPFGLSVMRSGFIPRILGILLIVNGFAYVVAGLTSLLLPAYAGVVSRWALIPETGELWILLWLLIKGVRHESDRLPPLRVA